MKRRTRYIDINTEIELSILEMTEDEVETLKNTANKILRICHLVTQDFDRTGVLKLAEEMINQLETVGYQ